MKESQLENKTTIATNDYVRMVDENNNSVKIKKDSFMAAIRNALPSIISDGETGGGSVLSIINGALKTRTDANLASVLGVLGHRNETFIQSGESIVVTNNQNALVYFVPAMQNWTAGLISKEGSAYRTILQPSSTLSISNDNDELKVTNVAQTRCKLIYIVWELQ